MTRPASTPSSRSSSRSLAPLAAAVGLAVALAPAAARACAGDIPSVVEDTTFDPHVLGDPAVAGLFYDPYLEGFATCESECVRRELLADWSAYLPGVDAAEWSKVLLQADLPTLDGLIFFLQGKKPAPAGFEHGSLAALPAAPREKVVRALFLVGFARRVEPFGAPPDWETASQGGAAVWAKRAARAGDAETLQKNGERSFAAARDPFLRQRYAFLLLRLRFYRQDWAGVVAFSKAQASVLGGPSASLRWRARYYLAGAHWRSKRFAEANLELARVAASAPALAGSAAADFHPMEESDWQATLALARTKQEKAWLWALVGLTRDGTAAMPEIARLDASSPWLPLLAVREVNRLEQRPSDLRELERVCLELAGKKGVDQPWVFDAVAGHVAALLGDVAAARARLDRAVQRAPAGNALLRTQARASLALAIAQGWRPGDAKSSEELAKLFEAGAGTEGQTSTAWGEVRKTLAGTCAAAGLREDAELFLPTSIWGASKKAEWREPQFVEALLRRVSTPKTPFERFMVKGSGYTPAGLQVELGRLQLVRGEYAAAAKGLAPVGGGALGTDPFVMHVIDCHDCDHEKYADAPWTLASFADRLATLETKARGKGDPAAKAAFELGSGLYNMTWSGNARVVFAYSHVAYPDTTGAERWFKTAYESAASRELKARAATMAAKCELARDEKATYVSKTWYPALRSLEGTKYEQEVLKECGWYREWKEGKEKK